MALNVLKVNLVFIISYCTYLMQATVEDINITNLYIPCLIAEPPQLAKEFQSFRF